MIQHTSPDGVRFYEVDGQFFPSATTVLECFPLEAGLKLFLQNNTKEQADKLLKDAGLQGSKVHYAIELMIAGEEISPEGLTRLQIDKIGKCEDTLVKYLMQPLTDKEDSMLTGFENWWFKYKPETLYSEKRLVSKDWGYAGTMDWMGHIYLPAKQTPKEKKEELKFDKVLCIVDWKTGKGLYKSYDLQVSSYCKAIEEMEKTKIEKAFLLQLGGLTKQKYSFKEITDIEENFRWFTDILKTWIRLHPDAKPMTNRIKLIHKL